MSMMSKLCRKRSGVRNSAMISCRIRGSNFVYSINTNIEKVITIHQQPSAVLIGRALIIEWSLFTTYLWLNFLPHSFKSDFGVDVLAVSHLRNVREKNHWLPVNEFVQDVFFQCLMVILDIVGFTQLEGVATMGENHRHNLVLIVQEVAMMDVSDGDFMHRPLTGIIK